MTFSCEDCMHYTYDDVADCYDCDMQLDEDELYRIYAIPSHQCPFYKFGDEYQIVKRQI